MNNITYSVLSVIAAIVFIVLLIASVFMLVNFYVCDSHTCKAFKISDKGDTVKEKMIILIKQICADGMWPFAYIGASILTLTYFFVLNVEMSVRGFFIAFVMSFVVIYFLFSFFAHHYIQPITSHITEYVSDNISDSNEQENEPENEIIPLMRLIDDDLYNNECV